MKKFLKNYLGHLLKSLPSSIFYVALIAAFVGIIAGVVALLINLYCETDYFFKNTFVLVSKWFFIIVFCSACIIDIVTIPRKKKYLDSLATRFDVPIDDIYDAVYRYNFTVKDFNTATKEDFMIRLNVKKTVSKLFK
jgi:hypothetical protein